MFPCAVANIFSIVNTVFCGILCFMMVFVVRKIRATMNFIALAGRQVRRVKHPQSKQTQANFIVYKKTCDRKFKTGTEEMVEVVNEVVEHVELSTGVIDVDEALQNANHDIEAIAADIENEEDHVVIDEHDGSTDTEYEDDENCVFQLQQLDDEPAYVRVIRPGHIEPRHQQCDHHSGI